MLPRLHAPLMSSLLTMGAGTSAGGGGAGFVGVLDAWSPDAAWSHWRALVTEPYSSTLLQVRRTSDDEPFDVLKQADGTADIAALQTFIGSSSAAVAALKDQVNGWDLQQSTSDQQRIIIDSGALVTVGGNAASKGLDAVGGGYLTTADRSPTYSGNTMTVFFRGQKDPSLSFEPFFHIANSAGGAGAVRPGIIHTISNSFDVTFVGNTGGDIIDNYLLSVIWDGTNTTFRDGTNTYVLANTNAFDAVNQFRLCNVLGIGLNNSSLQKVQEVALWFSDQTANEAAIRSAMLS